MKFLYACVCVFPVGSLESVVRAKEQQQHLCFLYLSIVFRLSFSSPHLFFCFFFIARLIPLMHLFRFQQLTPEPAFIQTSFSSALFFFPPTSPSPLLVHFSSCA